MTFFDVRPRQSGKTNTIVNLLKKNPGAVLLVPAQSHTGFYEQEGISRDRIFTPGSARSGLRGRNSPLFIDNLDHCFYEWLGTLPEYVTATGVLA